MNWRIIVRFSLDRDKGGQQRKELAEILHKCGIENTRTGTWESPAASPAKVAKSMSNILRALAAVSDGDPSQVTLDHLWIYIDRVD